MLTSLDSNIPIYAFADHRDESKTAISLRLIADLSASMSCVVSTQVMKEFANYCTKKLKPPMEMALLLQYLDDLAELHVVVVDVELIRRAVGRYSASKIGYYDALIVEASLTGGAEVLYSEDLQHGMRFGALQVINPFL